MYKASELREKSRDELLQLISELKGKLLALRFEAATGQLTETHLPSATKKDIALIFTVLKEKEQGINISNTKTVESKSTEKEAVVTAEAISTKVEEAPTEENKKEEAK